ncbi:hypothetical protein [Wenyingzhuangia sp. IMCC45574]
MKNFLLILFLSVFMLSCSNDSESDLVDNTPSDGTTKLTYTNDIAPIISSSCLNCHGATPSNGAPSSYHTYQLVKDGATRMDTRMNNASSPMPVAGLLPQATRDKFKQWITDGKLE